MNQIRTFNASSLLVVVFAVQVTNAEGPGSSPRRNLPLGALASSPAENIVAANGHEQILLFGRVEEPVVRADFKPVAANDLVVQYHLEQQSDRGEIVPGKVGNGLWIDGPEFVVDEIPTDILLGKEGFTISAWIKPEAEMQSPTLFGRESFYLMLERTKAGWRLRASSRAANNGILYTGRGGEFIRGEWQHIAVTFDGTEWAFYYNGTEVVRQTVPEGLQGFLPRTDSFYIGGDGRNKDRRYRGGIDDFRFYKRSLSAAEISEMIVNITPSYGLRRKIPFDRGTIHDLSFSPSGELLLAAGGRGAESGSATLYDVKTGTATTTIGDESDSVLSADISADHRLVAIGTPEKLIKVFSTETEKPLYQIDKHTDWVTSVRFSPDGQFLATGDRNGGIHIWESETGGIVYSLDEHKVKITALCWRADGKVLASASEDGKFILWDMKDGWATQSVAAHEGNTVNGSRRTGVLDITFVRDGRIVTIGRDLKLCVWQPDGTLHSATELTSMPLKVCLSADNQNAFVGEFNGDLVAWNLATLKPKALTDQVTSPVSGE